MIEKIIITSLFTIGYCCTFWEGMIFEKIGDWLEAHLPEWINKPTWSCYICTCFWLGTALYWLVFPYCTKYIRWNGELFEWGFSVGCAMGLNAVVSQFTNKPEELETKEPIDINIVSNDSERKRD